MRILRAIVQPSVAAMLDFRHDRRLGGAIGPKLVGDDPLRRVPLLRQEPRQQSSGSLGITMDLHDFVEHVPVLIDGPPKIALLATDRDPEASGAGESHPRALSEPDVTLSRHPAPIVRPRPWIKLQ